MCICAMVTSVVCMHTVYVAHMVNNMFIVCSMCGCGTSGHEFMYFYYHVMRGLYTSIIDMCMCCIVHMYMLLCAMCI